MAIIGIIEDDKLIRWLLVKTLSSKGYEYKESESLEGGLSLVRGDEVDVLIADYVLPDGDAETLLRFIAQHGSEVPTIVITGYGSIDKAVQAMKLGAVDFITKPFDPERLVMVVEKALQNTRLWRELKALRRERMRFIGNEPVIAVSPQMQEVVSCALKAGEADHTTVLLVGETGVRKDVIAKLIHFSSGRSSAPFVPILCTALPEQLLESELMGHEPGAFTDAKTRKAGPFELADGGTIYLDEIGDMPLSIQAKVLRLLEEKQFRRVGGLRDISVDVRIIAGTNRDLGAMLEEGRFRRDLFYRLNVFPIRIPPLRERREDIRPLAFHFLRLLRRTAGREIPDISEGALRALEAYRWPGNVRELKNVIERAVLLRVSGGIGLNDLPKEIIASWREKPRWDGSFSLPPKGIDIEELEKSLLYQALQRTAWNHTRAAELLGLTRDQVRYRIQKYGLKAPSP